MKTSNEEMILETENIRITLLPEIGCKITKLEFLRYDFQWLWQDENRPVIKPKFCSDYAAYDISGFDECFPNIGLSEYPADNRVILCDHGEIWSKEWKVARFENSLVGSVDLVAMPLTFQREIYLEEETIRFNYQVKNNGQITYDYMWSAHPLFQLPNNYRVLLPHGQKMYKEFGFGGRLGADGEDGYLDHLKQLTWPMVKSDTGETVDLTEVIPNLRVTDKVTVETQGVEELILVNNELSAGLKFVFDENITHVGICSNLTAWPPGPFPATWIAIEPMIGISDRLDENIKLGKSKKIDAGETQTWSFSISLVALNRD